MIRGVMRYLAAFGSAGVLAVLAAVFSPLVWPADPDASLVVRNGQLVGEVVGYVWQADANTATIHVSSSVVGLRTFPVTINADTRIIDGDKEGAFGDLDRHARVHLVYEARPGGRLASSIMLLRQSAGPETVVDASPTPVAGYWVEVGTFVDPDAAGALAARLLEHNMMVSIESVPVGGGRQRMLRVQVGPFPDEAAGRAAEQNLRAIGHQAHALW
jgi:SPOR domain